MTDFTFTHHCEEHGKWVDSEPASVCPECGYFDLEEIPDQDWQAMDALLDKQRWRWEYKFDQDYAQSDLINDMRLDGYTETDIAMLTRVWNQGY